jgi:Holliday junction DNA helicase RuvB
MEFPQESSEQRFLTPESKGISDQYEDKRLRPTDFKEYIGQEQVIKNIEIMVDSSLKRKSAMDHVLFSGPPGLGKTSLGLLIAKALGSELHMISGPAIEKKGDLAAVLTNLGPRDVLFIDEIHRMHVSIEEILYSAIEDFRLDILIGQGATARTMQIDLVPFTLIGATTRSGLLSNPLRDRFMASFHFDFYGTDEIAQIIRLNANKLKIDIKEQAIDQMSGRSRGTPRIANRILRRVRDFMTSKDLEYVDLAEVNAALELLNIDHFGLDPMDRKILKVMKDYYSGGPVGIEALCATLGEDRSTLEEVYEPFLLKEGFVLRTPRGRVLSEKASNYCDSF